LERTLLDIQSENEKLREGTRQLQENLTESENAEKRLSELSEELRKLSSEQELAFRRQSVLLERSEKRLRGWRLASIIEGAALAAVILFGALAN
jgi:hypothetical protein